MSKQECLKIFRIGQSAAKPRTGERSTTIGEGQVDTKWYRNTELPTSVGRRYSLVLWETISSLRI